MFPFLRLPTDLRVLMYEYVLVAEGPIDLYPLILPHNVDDIRHFHRCVIRDGVHPVILRVCRQMHDEAGPVLYGGNKFHLSRFLAWGALVHWLRQIGGANRRSLRSLAVVSPTRVMSFREMMPEPWMFGGSNPLKSFRRFTGVLVYERRPMLFSSFPLAAGVELLKDCESLRSLSLLIHPFSHPWGKAVGDGDERTQWLIDQLAHLPRLKVKFVLLDTIKLMTESHQYGVESMRFKMGFDPRYAGDFDRDSIRQGTAPIKTEANEALATAKRLGCDISCVEVDELGFWAAARTLDISHFIDADNGCFDMAADRIISESAAHLRLREALQSDWSKDVTCRQMEMWARWDERVAQTTLASGAVSAIPCNEGYELHWH